MIDQIIAIDAASVQRQQVPMKSADDGDKIARILHGKSIVGSALLNGIRT